MKSRLQIKIMMCFAHTALRQLNIKRITALPQEKERRFTLYLEKVKSNLAHKYLGIKFKGE